MNNNNILFVTDKKSQCGVYEFGENVFNAIKLSKKYNFIKVECSDINELKEHFAQKRPIAIIYNYIPATMPWVASTIFRNGFLKNNIEDSAKQGRKYAISINHPELANRLFDFYIAPDKTLLLKNPYVFKHGRPIQKYTNNFSTDKLMIGSFCFAKNGYEDLIELVQSEFDEAEIIINIPFADFGDKDGKSAKKAVSDCIEIAIKMVIDH